MKKLVSVFAFLAAVLFAGSAYAAEGVHKIAVHVDQNDPAIMNLANSTAAKKAKTETSFFIDILL